MGLLGECRSTRKLNSTRYPSTPRTIARIRSTGSSTLRRKVIFPAVRTSGKVKALLRYLPDQYHAESLRLLWEPRRRYEKMRDHLVIQHPTYEGYPLGYYKYKLDDLKAPWVNPAQVRGRLLKLRNLQKKMCEN